MFYQKTEIYLPPNTYAAQGCVVSLLFLFHYQMIVSQIKKTNFTINLERVKTFCRKTLSAFIDGETCIVWFFIIFSVLYCLFPKPGSLRFVAAGGKSFDTNFLHAIKLLPHPHSRSYSTKNSSQALVSGVNETLTTSCFSRSAFNVLCINYKVAALLWNNSDLKSKVHR